MLEKVNQHILSNQNRPLLTRFINSLLDEIVAQPLDQAFDDGLDVRSEDGLGHVEATVLGPLFQCGLQELDEFGGVGGVGPWSRDFTARPHQRAVISRRVMIKHQDL